MEMKKDQKPKKKIQYLPYIMKPMFSLKISHNAKTTPILHFG